MSEPSFASLNQTLLARKGGAKPAMRPQHGLVPSATATAEPLEDLGWNDMGSQGAAIDPASPPEADQHDNNVVQLPAQDNDVHRQQRQLAEEVRAPSKPTRPRRSALARGKRAAFTLRLDAERHLKLRLASTITNRSAQQIVTEALDRMLGEMDEIQSLAEQVKQD